MNILELNQKYKNGELTSAQGDKQFRFKIFASLFDNLFENKIVIHDRFTCIAKIERIGLLPDYFSAFVIPQTFIRTGTPSDNRQERVFQRLQQGWDLACKWEYMRIVGTSLCSSPYASWLIWCDPKTVELAEKLLEAGKSMEALKLTFYENE